MAALAGSCAADQGLPCRPRQPAAGRWLVMRPQSVGCRISKTSAAQQLPAVLLLMLVSAAMLPTALSLTLATDKAALLALKDSMTSVRFQQTCGYHDYSCGAASNQRQSMARSQQPHAPCAAHAWYS